MLLLIVAMMTSQKKNEKSRIEYDINGRKFEFWMKKNYSIDDMFIRCIYVLYQ